MSFRPFTSESYAQDDRPEAWRDVLAAVGLQPATGHAFLDGHATASHRQASGVALTRMAAGAQSVGPLSHANEELPIALMPVEDGMVLKSAAGHRIVPVGHLVLLPRSGDWSIVFQRDMRAIVLSVTSEALHGRLSGKPRLGEPRVVPPSGFADVFARLLDATARTLDTLSDAEWNAVAQSLVDLLLTLAHQLAASTSDAGSSATQAALLHRICQTIERRLDDPELVPARVAQAEGIS
ncbi:AraC-like ligand-binding domain-containing protein, partial [Bradyrhizobium sp. P5_C11_2]